MSLFETNDYVDFWVEKKVSEKKLQLDKQDFFLWEKGDLLEKKESCVKNTRNLAKEFKNFQKEYEEGNHNIFDYFPLQNLALEEQLHFFDHIMTLKHSKRFLGNKVIHNLKKISFEEEETRFDALFPTPPKPTVLGAQEESLKKKHRHIIRKDPFRYQKIMESTSMMGQNIIYQKDFHSFYPFANVVYDALMQAIIYWLVTLPPLPHQLRGEGLDRVEEVLDSYLLEIKEKAHDSPEKLDLSTSLPMFVGFLKVRNRFEHFSNIANTLLQEQEAELELFGNISPEFQVAKWQSKGDISPEELKILLNEGKGRCDFFPKKLQQTRDLIRLFQHFGRRNVSAESLLDLKVYFREIYISKSKYKTTALNITQKIFDNEATIGEQQFLHEKISRGYFREHTPIEFFLYKTRLQKKLYQIILHSHLSYDLTTACQGLDRLTQTMLPLAIDPYLELCKKA